MHHFCRNHFTYYSFTMFICCGKLTLILKNKLPVSYMVIDLSSIPLRIVFSYFLSILKYMILALTIAIILLVLFNQWGVLKATVFVIVGIHFSFHHVFNQMCVPSQGILFMCQQRKGPNAKDRSAVSPRMLSVLLRILKVNMVTRVTLSVLYKHEFVL